MTLYTISNLNDLQGAKSLLLLTALLMLIPSTAEEKLEILQPSAQENVPKNDIGKPKYKSLKYLPKKVPKYAQGQRMILVNPCIFMCTQTIKSER